MTAFSVQYRSDTGQLQREGLFDPAELTDTDPVLTIRTYQTPPDLTAVRWNPLASPPDYEPIPLPVVTPVMVISKLSFLKDRLTLPVVAAALAREASDPVIAAFRMFIDNADEIHLDDDATVMGIAHLVALTILTPADQARILAPVMS